MPARRTTAVVLLAALGTALVAWGASGPRDASLPLYAQGVALDATGAVVDVPVGSPAALHDGTRVLDVPGTRADDALAEEQRAWLAAGTLPGGADGPYADMVADALLDLHTLLLPDGAAVAAWTDRWRYVWPRDAAFVAVALARTGHGDDALDVLGFLDRVQAPDGSFEARYLPDGSGPPDARTPQTDGTGWALWAAGEVVDAQPADRRRAVAERLRGLVTRSAAGAVALTADDGLPPASPDYWEVAEDELTLGTVAPLLAGLESAPALLELLGEDGAAAAAREAAGRTRDAVEREFGDDTAYGRYAGGSVPDAASAFVLPPFQPEPLTGALDAWQASAEAMARPAGGLAPGAAWKRDGISWTPQTSLYALVAAENGRPDEARARLDWLDAHRTMLGALPEKVLADGSPAAVAPLAWTAACVVLAVGALDG
ncbi:glycoside hydrolase family 15 protein [Cellulomonas sp. P4]|uniref:glycoside hydrolase family 15 n=1 Tax=Cellulomonas sp. P4 TaxID=3142533 RepID=UPI0031BA7BDE